MSKHHPTAAAFGGFLRDASAPGSKARNAHLVRHLLADCAPCRENLNEAAARQRAGLEYSAAFEKAGLAVAAFLARPTAPEASPQDLLAELAQLPADEREKRLAEESRYAHPSLVHHLIDSSHAIRYQDASQMLHFAELARIAAEACTSEAAGSDLRLADLRGQAWRQYGNALRVSARLREAEEAFAKAGSYLGKGTRDPLLRARLYTQLVSLRMFQNRFHEAIGLATEASQIYEDLGELHSFASTGVQRAIACLYAGEMETAIAALNQAIPLIDPERDAHLLLAACHNLVRCYIDLGRPEQALSIYFETRDLYRRFQDPLIRLRVTWQEGQLLRDLGHLRAAEGALKQARQGFVDRDLLLEVALVSLDLASVYVRLRSEEDLKQTVAETVPIFRALEMDRAALASLLQLQQLASQSRRALELIRLLTSRIEQLPPRRFRS